MQTLVHLNSQNVECLEGEATKCRLCKHCGCMLSTDKISLCKLGYSTNKKKNKKKQNKKSTLCGLNMSNFSYLGA